MNESRNEIIEGVARAIKEHRRFLIATHVRPDGDAVGALLGMAAILDRMGKEPTPACQDNLPPGYEFLLDGEIVHRRIPDPAPFDAAILVDCGEVERVGEELAGTVRRVPLVINIDHHATHAPFGRVSWVEPSASSTCEMLYDLLPRLGVELDARIAARLYTGVMTDTGSFRFANTNRRVFEVSTELVRAGADPARIAARVYDSSSPERLLLLARVLSTVSYHDGHRLAVAEMSQKMFRETGADPVDSEGFINLLRSVKSVRMAMFVREEADGSVRVSLRSKEGVDVAAFAQRYGGGGHRQAAALRVSGALKRVRRELVRDALACLKGGDS